MCCRHNERGIPGEDERSTHPEGEKIRVPGGSFGSYFHSHGERKIPVQRPDKTRNKRSGEIFPFVAVNEALFGALSLFFPSISVCIIASLVVTVESDDRLRAQVTQLYSIDHLARLHCYGGVVESEASVLLCASEIPFSQESLLHFSLRTICTDSYVGSHCLISFSF